MSCLHESAAETASVYFCKTAPDPRSRAQVTLLPTLHNICEIYTLWDRLYIYLITCVVQGLLLLILLNFIIVDQRTTEALNYPAAP